MVTVRAGFQYFTAVFVVGFLLGALRNLLLAPAVGDLAAVALELPLILAVAWFVCRRLVRKVPATLPDRLVMGGVALALLIGAEVALALRLGDSLDAVLAAFGTPPGLLGLAGQVVFALLPVAALRTG